MVVQTQHDCVPDVLAAIQKYDKSFTMDQLLTVDGKPHPYFNINEEKSYIADTVWIPLGLYNFRERYSDIAHSKYLD
jgi:hypothetical protein